MLSPVADGRWSPPPLGELQRMLPQYEILSFLENRELGAVYKAYQRDADRLVAIMVLPPDLCSGTGNRSLAVLKQEITAVARAHHPGIATMHDADVTPDGLLYVVTDLVEGIPLARMLARKGKFREDQALNIAAHLCEALAYAHRLDLVHRFLRPSSVIIDFQGVVKVTDFGLAKWQRQVTATLPNSDMFAGSQPYLAPEELCAGAVIDQRVDVYSLGVILYQMLTGEIPRGRFEPPSRLSPGIDFRFDAVVDRALHTDRAQRYFSAHEMLQDLTPILHGPEEFQSVQWVHPVPAGSGVPTDPVQKTALGPAPAASNSATILIISIIVVVIGVITFLTVFLSR